MERLKKTNCLVFMLLRFVAFFCTIGCTSDDFFGIDEEYEGLDFQTLNKIARSKEYIEFQKMSFICMEEPAFIDTMEMELIDCDDNLYFYASKKTYSIRPVLDARQKLVEIYPEYEKATSNERNQILNLALMNNNGLMRWANKCIPNALKITKSVNEEADAVKWIRKKSQNELVSDSYEWYGLITGANSEWSVGSCRWYAYNYNYNTIFDALCYSEGLAKEVGGYCWQSDGSGVLIDDPNATPYKMTFGHWSNEPLPSFDFHVHPSGVLYPSEEDRNTWRHMPWIIHRIYDYSGCYKVFKNRQEN